MFGFPRMIATVALLAFSPLADGKETTFKSDEFGVMAIFPGEVEEMAADYALGRIGSFSAASEDPLYIAQIGVNISPKIAAEIASGKITAKEMTDSITRSRCKEGSGVLGTLKTSWGTWGADEVPLLNYRWQAVGFVGEGVKSYHIGRAFVRKGRYYSIQITTLESGKAAEAALERLAMSFAILPQAKKKD